MEADEIAIVSGLPRSGTSMMMRMIVTGGIPALSDGLRTSDEDNPLGYFELEAVKKTKQDASWLDAAPGKVVKVVHILLRDLPPNHRYRVVMMHRDLDEIIASQRKMLDRLGRTGALATAETLKKLFASQLQAARSWVASQPNFSCLDVEYHKVIADAAGQAARVADFVGCQGRAAEMAAAVDGSLYRNRAGPRSSDPGTT